jgi:hypothetical protein
MLPLRRPTMLLPRGEGFVTMDVRVAATVAHLTAIGPDTPGALSV